MSILKWKRATGDPLVSKLQEKKSDLKTNKEKKNPIFLKLTKEFVQDDNGEDDATEKVDIKGCEVSNL